MAAAGDCVHGADADAVGVGGGVPAAGAARAVADGVGVPDVLDEADAVADGDDVPVTLALGVGVDDMWGGRRV
jgi:hypothetical protein